MFLYNDLSNLERLKGMSIPSLMHILFYSLARTGFGMSRPMQATGAGGVQVNRLSNFGRQPSKANETAVGGINNPPPPTCDDPTLLPGSQVQMGQRLRGHLRPVKSPSSSCGHWPETGQQVPWRRRRRRDLSVSASRQ